MAPAPAGLRTLGGAFAPAVAMIVYIPLFQTYKLLLFPKPFEASFPGSAAYFYTFRQLDQLELAFGRHRGFGRRSPGREQEREIRVSGRRISPSSRPSC